MIGNRPQTLTGHIVKRFHAKRDSQRTFGTFASSNAQAEASACKRAKFFPTHGIKSYFWKI